MRVTFRTMNLSTLGKGFHRVPLKAWRITVILAPNLLSTNYFDGVPMTGLYTDNAFSASGLVRFVVGGVFAPDGTPVLVDKDLEIGIGDAFSVGLVIFEDIE